MTQKSRQNPICVALDMGDLNAAATLADQIKPEVGYIKLGLEFFYHHGRAGYERLAALGIPVFLDLKLHDIPNTVAEGLAALLTLNPPPAIINLHGAGGAIMMRAARAKVPPTTKLIAVTILTSLSDEDIWAAGFDPQHDTGATALKLAKLAKASGLDGVVCSPHDLSRIRAELGPDFLTVVPGIRQTEGDNHDQKRVATPKAAYAAGADVLVIGRAITEAKDPVAAARNIRLELGL